MHDTGTGCTCRLDSSIDNIDYVTVVYIIYDSLLLGCSTSTGILLLAIPVHSPSSSALTLSSGLSVAAVHPNPKHVRFKGLKVSTYLYVRDRHHTSFMCVNILRFFSKIF